MKIKYRTEIKRNAITVFKRKSRFYYRNKLSAETKRDRTFYDVISLKHRVFLLSSPSYSLLRSIYFIFEIRQSQ